MKIRGMDVGFTTDEVEEMLALIRPVLEKGWLMWGDMQAQLEDGFRKETGRKHAILFNSNTSAQEALFKIWEPAKVAFVGNQFVSPVFAALRQGATVEWVDIEVESMGPQVVALEAAVLGAGDVLVLQETGGFVPANIVEIADWCRSRRVIFLEDSAQAAGASHPAGPSGSFGDAAVYSLSGTKPLTSGGQGGLVVTDDEEVAGRCFRLKNYGRTEMFQRGEFVEQGWNTHCTEIQAAVGIVALKHAEEHRLERERAARVYDAALETFLRPGAREGKPTWYKYVLLLPDGADREAVRAKLAAQDIELSSGVYDWVTYRLPAFEESQRPPAPLPGVERFCARHICLPCHHRLHDGDAERVVDALEEALQA